MYCSRHHRIRLWYSQAHGFIAFVEIDKAVPVINSGAPAASPTPESVGDRQGEKYNSWCCTFFYIHENRPHNRRTYTKFLCEGISKLHLLKGPERLEYRPQPHESLTSLFKRGHIAILGDLPNGLKWWISEETLTNAKFQQPECRFWDLLDHIKVATCEAVRSLSRMLWRYLAQRRWFRLFSVDVYVLRHFPKIISTPLNTFNPVNHIPPGLRASQHHHLHGRQVLQLKTAAWSIVVTTQCPLQHLHRLAEKSRFLPQWSPNCFYSVKRWRSFCRSLSFPTPFSNRTPRRKCSKTLDSKSNDSSDSRTPWITNQVIPFHLSILTTQPSISLSCGQHSPFLLYNPHPPCWRPVQPQTRQHIKRES